MEQSGWKYEVYINPEAVGYLATKHLLDLGHRKILYFCRPCKRINGYRQALEERGIPLNSDYMIDNQDGYNALEAFRYYCNLRDKPTGIIFFSDWEAAAFMQYALLAGIRIPEELSVIGTDGEKLSEFYHPSITTICQQPRNQGREAAKMLLSVLDKGNVQTPAILEPNLSRQMSCQALQNHKEERIKECTLQQSL